MLREKFELDVYTGEEFLTKEEMIERARKADAMVAHLRDPIDAEFIQSLEKMKIIADYAVGYNNIDVQVAMERGIYVTHTPGVLTEATADIAFALILAVARRIVESDKFVRDGKFVGWKPKLMLGYDLYGKTLGIIGMGRISVAIPALKKTLSTPSTASPVAGSICVIAEERGIFTRIAPKPIGSSNVGS